MAEENRSFTTEMKRAKVPSTRQKLTRDDLKNMLRFGVHVAKVDGEMNEEERLTLVRFARAMKLSEQERNLMLKDEITLAQAMRRLSGSPAETLLVKVMCAVANADGQILPVEQEFFERVLERLKEQVFVYTKSKWDQYEAEVLKDFANLS